MVTPRIIIDSRELKSPVAKELDRLGCNIQIEGNMEIVDCVVSDRVAFERKTAEDWGHDFIEAKEFFPKLHDLKKAYEIPILIFECDPIEIFTVRNIPNDTVEAILNTICMMGISVRYTYNALGTAKLLKWFALKEQTGGQTRLIQLHGSRRKLSPQEQKIYIISAIPGIGRSTAECLLMMFGSVEAVMSAPKEKLMALEGIGDKTAEHIRKIVSERY